MAYFGGCGFSVGLICALLLVVVWKKKLEGTQI